MCVWVSILEGERAGEASYMCEGRSEVLQFYGRMVSFKKSLEEFSVALFWRERFQKPPM